MGIYNYVAASDLGSAAEVDVSSSTIPSSAKQSGNWTVQNEGSAAVSVYAKLVGATSFGLLGEVSAGEIKAMLSVSLVEAFKFVGGNGDTGVIVY